jgi:putative hydrolase of the HAD superfamily
MDTLGKFSTERLQPHAERNSQMRAPFRAVVFDFFGTLTCAVTRGARHDHIARVLGCEPAAFRRALDETFYERATGAYGDATASMAAVAHRLGKYPTRRALEVARRDRVDALRDDVRLRHEAVPVLRALRMRGIRTAVVSDCGPELVEILPELPVWPYLTTRVLSVEARRRKPDPMMYLTASARLGVRPGDCLYVGDGGSRELTGANAVGMTAVRLAAPDLAGHLTFDRDEVWSGDEIRTLGEVLALVSAPAGVPMGR